MVTRERSWLTMQELCNRLLVPQSIIERLEREGKIKGVRVNKHVWYRLNEVMLMI